MVAPTDFGTFILWKSRSYCKKVLPSPLPKGASQFEEEEEEKKYCEAVNVSKNK